LEERNAYEKGNDKSKNSKGPDAYLSFKAEKEGVIFLQLERIHQQEYMIQVINITFLIETALIELRSQSLKSNSVFTFGQSAFMFTK
jgi:hypothetical protein